MNKEKFYCHDLWLLLALGILSRSCCMGVEQDDCPETCGCANHDPTNQKIIGGENATRNEFPWQVAIFRDGSPNCGGSIIGDRWVLSAAHCFDRHNGTRQVYVSDHDLGLPDGEVVYNVTNTIVHPDFETAGNLLIYDYALVQLESPLTWSRTVRPVCLPPNADVNYTGQRATISGWGRIEVSLNSTIYRTVLRKASLTVIPFERYVQYGTILAGQDVDNRTSTCFGDSGGPLVVEGSGNHYTLIGVTSFGQRDCNPNFPTFFADVSKALTWIANISGITPTPLTTSSSTTSTTTTMAAKNSAVCFQHSFVLQFVVGLYWSDFSYYYYDF